MRTIIYWDEEQKVMKERDATPDEEREFNAMATREEPPPTNVQSALLAHISSMSNEEIQALLSANQTN